MPALPYPSPAVLTILIVDGNTPETNVRIRKSGGRPQGELFKDALGTEEGLRTEVLSAADCAVALPGNERLRAYAGIAWTGSALNLTDRTPAVLRQVELAKRALLSGAFIYGSCWGLQVAAAACGAKVCANPLGREIGIARDITLTSRGRQHSLLRHRADRFDALAVHRDVILPLPDSMMTVLAGNTLCPIQAAELRLGAGTFWGVQYHPEYSFSDVASAFRRYGPQLIKEGLFADLGAVETTAALYEAGDSSEAERVRETIRRLQIHPDLTNREFRNLEIRNWLAALRERSQTNVG